MDTDVEMHDATTLAPDIVDVEMKDLGTMPYRILEEITAGIAGWCLDEVTILRCVINISCFFFLSCSRANFIPFPEVSPPVCPVHHPSPPHNGRSDHLLLP